MIVVHPPQREIRMSETATDEAVVMAYLRKPWSEWTETYVIANSVGLRGQTPKVRRILKRLEVGGLVVRRASWRHNMLEWKLPLLPTPSPQ